MSGADLVSIVVPTFNRADLISEAITSVLPQDYPHWELIVVDDGSTDDTERVVAALRSDPRISYHRVERCGKFGRVRNEGIRRAEGDYVAFLDSDDLWRRDKLRFQLELLERYPGSSFVFSNGDQFGPRAIRPPDFTELFVGSMLLPLLENQRSFVFYPSSLLFARREVDRIGYLDETLTMVSDVEFFYRLAREGTGIFTNERLVRMRKHGGNVSLGNEIVAQQEYIALLDHYLDEQVLSRVMHARLLSRQYHELGRIQLAGGKPLEALTNFLHSAARRPWSRDAWRGVAYAGLESLNRLSHNY